MPYITTDSFLRASEQTRHNIVMSHIALGSHPETENAFYLRDRDQFAGTYMIGTQGQGKSYLLEWMLRSSSIKPQATMFIDPHSDSIYNFLSRWGEMLPLNRVCLFELKRPFPLNFLANRASNAIGQTRIVDSLMHVFRVLYPEVMVQLNLPNFVRAAAITLFANPGSTLLDMAPLLEDADFRYRLVRNVTDASVRQFWAAYDNLSPAERRQQTAPLANRLKALFMGRSLVREIVGQPGTLDLRQMIEQTKIMLFDFPIKTMPLDAKLIGTLLIAQIHEAIFSFVDTPKDQRPGLNLFVDEFANFATPDFAEMFSEGRKFGVKITLAHQYRDQLPGFLKSATMTANNIIAFRTAPEDSMEVARAFPVGEAKVDRETIEPDVMGHLKKYPSDNADVQRFMHTYFLPMERQKKGGSITIASPGFRFDDVVSILTNTQKKETTVPEPTLALNNLLYQVMRENNADMDIPALVVEGFSNCGFGFYAAFQWSTADILSCNIEYPSTLIMQDANGKLICVRKPDDSREQLYHFIFYLRQVMKHLAANPIGKQTKQTTADIAAMLVQLPKRACFVRSADDVGVIYTMDLPPLRHPRLTEDTIAYVRKYTREQYCQQLEDQETQPLSVVPPAALPTEPMLDIPLWEDEEA